MELAERGEHSNRLAEVAPDHHTYFLTALRGSPTRTSFVFQQHLLYPPLQDAIVASVGLPFARRDGPFIFYGDYMTSLEQQSFMAHTAADAVDQLQFQCNDLKRDAPLNPIIRREEVMRITGIRSRATLYRWMAEGHFCKSVKLGPRAIGWRLRDVQAWINSRQSAKGE